MEVKVERSSVETYSFEVAVYHAVRVEITKPF